MKKKSFPVINIGTVSLLMVLLVLCLVTFAMMSLSGAASDLHYSQALADHNTAYYEASSEAARVEADLDQILREVYASTIESGTSYDEFLIQAMTALNACPADVTCDFSGDVRQIFYQVPCGDSQQLNVTLTIQDEDQMGNKLFRVTEWRKSSTEEWSGDSHLPVLENN